MQQKEWC